MSHPVLRGPEPVNGERDGKAACPRPEEPTTALGFRKSHLTPISGLENRSLPSMTADCRLPPFRICVARFGSARPRAFKSGVTCIVERSCDSLLWLPGHPISSSKPSNHKRSFFHAHRCLYPDQNPYYTSAI